jgi:hypothetical protein
MRFKFKGVLGTLMVALVVSAGASASASAAGWWVGGSELAGSASLASQTKALSNYEMTWSGITIACTGQQLESAEIVAPSKLTAKALKYTGCVVSGSLCRLEATTIKTEPITGTLEKVAGSSKEDVVTIKPTSGTKLFSFALEGECSAAGTYRATGQMKVKAPKGQEELAEQEMAANSSGEVKLGTTTLTIKGDTLLKLQSGQAWGFR